MSERAARRMDSYAGRVPGVAVVLTVLVVGFSLTSPGFASWPNLSNVIVQSTVLLLLALPMTFVIMTEGLDLSVGATLTVSSLIIALVVIATGSIPLAFLAGLGVGIAFGLGNGALVALAGVPPFVATLGTLGVGQGLALIVSGGQSVVGIPREMRAIYSGEFLGLPVPIWIAVVAYLVMHLLLYRTRYGTYIFAVGGNREALKLAGVSDRLVLVATYTIMGVMAAIGALLMTARMSGGHPTSGVGLEFDAIAAVAVGGTSFERGNGWLFGTLLGVLAVGVLRNGLNLLAIPSSAQVACIGIMVILALLIDGFRSGRT